MRQKYNLVENPSCGDCLTTAFCSPCALCQEARELKFRGKRSNSYWKIVSLSATDLEKNPGPVHAPQFQGQPAVVMQPMSQAKGFPQGNMQYWNTHSKERSIEIWINSRMNFIISLLALFNRLH